MHEKLSAITAVTTVSDHLLLIHRNDMQDAFVCRKNKSIFVFTVQADGAIIYDLRYGRLYQNREAVDRAWPRIVTAMITNGGKSIFNMNGPAWITTVHTMTSYGDIYPRHRFVESDEATVNQMLNYAAECYWEYTNWLKD